MFSPDELLLASGSVDSTVRLQDVISGASTATLQGHHSSVNSVAFSPDGLLLASGVWSATIRLWDVKSGANTMALQSNNPLFYSLHSFAFYDDATALICHSSFSGIYIWVLAFRLPCHIHPESSSPHISYAGPASFLRFWSRWIEVVRNSQMRRICRIPPIYSPNLRTLSMAGQRIAFGCEDGRVVILSTGGLDI